MSDNKQMINKKYLMFFSMIGTSMLLMYGLMYVNSYQIFDHARFSETRLFMTLIMGGSMMIVMMAFMFDMYPNIKANIWIFIGAFLLILSSIWLVRSQSTVNDVDYMEAMIPHHSIAILTSERSRIQDPRVQDLAEEIIEAQRREIKEMEWLITDIKKNGIPENEEEAGARPVPSFSGTK